MYSLTQIHKFHMFEWLLSWNPNARLTVSKDLLLLLGQIIQPPHTLVCPPAKQLQNTGYMKLEEGWDIELLLSTQIQRRMEKCAIQVQCVTTHKSFVQKVNPHDLCRRRKKVLNCHPHLSPAWNFQQKRKDRGNSCIIKGCIFTQKNSDMGNIFYIVPFCMLAGVETSETKSALCNLFIQLYTPLFCHQQCFFLQNTWPEVWNQVATCVLRQNLKTEQSFFTIGPAAEPLKTFFSFG